MDVVRTILLWLLGVAFLVAGGMKALVPLAQLSQQTNMGWVARTPASQVRLAGVSEVAAGVAFLLTVLDVGFVADNQWIAGLAAVGLVVIMVLAAVRVHRPAGEPIVPNVVLGLLAALLAVLLFAG